MIPMSFFAIGVSAVLYAAVVFSILPIPHQWPDLWHVGNGDGQMGNGLTGSSYPPSHTPRPPVLHKATAS
jgi:hypothetical protein